MTRTAKEPYKFVGVHLDDLADGRVLEPGGTVDLTQPDLEEPHNQRLLNDGLLLKVENPTKKGAE